MGVLRSRSSILPSFLFKLLISTSFKNHLSKLHDGANINNLKFGQIKNFPIPLPSLSIQKQIIKKLDAVFAEIDKATSATQKNIKNAEALFQSYLKQIFLNNGKNWVKMPFDKACVLQRGFDLPKRQRKKGEYPLLSANGVTDHIDTWKIKAPGVITGRSGTIGKVHFIEKDFWALNTALYVKNFQGNDEKFIYYFLTYFNLNSFSSGASVPTLNRNNVHKQQILFPSSKNEQKLLRIECEKLQTKLIKLKPIFEKKLFELKSLKKSLLIQAFSGQLTKDVA